jgi:hypothetical protein
MVVDAGAYPHFIKGRELLAGIRDDKHVIN